MRSLLPLPTTRRAPTLRRRGEPHVLPAEGGDLAHPEARVIEQAAQGGFHGRQREREEPLALLERERAGRALGSPGARGLDHRVLGQELAPQAPLGELVEGGSPAEERLNRHPFVGLLVEEEPHGVARERHDLVGGLRDDDRLEGLEIARVGLHGARGPLLHLLQVLEKLPDGLGQSHMARTSATG